ncbi:MAG: DUF6356 family protein [Gammaproteobacteria bacterium]|jgi:hypothetical protein
MNIFNEHPQKQGISYMAHLIFAMRVAVRLFNGVAVFASHAIFPFIPIGRSLDLEATIIFLQEQNDWIETKKMAKKSRLDTKNQWDVLSLGE